MQKTVNSNVTSWAVVHPDSYRVFQKYGIDFCCGGKKSLAEACLEKGLNPKIIAGEIKALEGRLPETEDWSQCSLKNLINHIVSTHHQYLREELPLLYELSVKILKKHGSSYTFLSELHNNLETITEEILTHILKEEQILFPMIVEKESGCGCGKPINVGCGSLLNPIASKEFEHEEISIQLDSIRKLTDNFFIDPNMDASFQALYKSLRGLDMDLRVQVHKENNFLFPRALKL